MNSDCAFGWAFWWGFYHFPLDVCEDAELEEVREFRGRRDGAYRVLSREHSTHPRSGPKASVGLRASNGDRPSSRRDCLSAANKKSRSGIDGDGGRIFTVEGVNVT